MRNAIEAFNVGDYTKCIQACSQEIANEEQAEKTFEFEARNLRGSLYMLKCQYAEARSDFDFILNASEAPARLKSNTCIKLTALNLQNNQEEEAFENYDRAIELDSQNEDIYCNRAQVFAMKGLFDKCFEDFDKCLTINPENRIAKIQKAFFEFRKFYASLQMYTQATGQTAEAIRAHPEFKTETVKLEKVLNDNSDVPEALNLYAQILSEQEDYAKAEKYYEIALEKDPKNAALLVQRALNLMTWQNEFDRPVEMLNQAIEIDETCEFAFETLATIEIQRFVFFLTKKSDFLLF
jgi:import receptor subunit TOM70